MVRKCVSNGMRVDQEYRMITNDIPVKLLINNMGVGVGLLVFWLIFIVPIFLAKAASVLSSWVLGLWAKQYETHDPAQVSVVQ